MKKQAGFTLIELMVVVAIAGIMLGFGVPKISRMLQVNRVVANLNSLSFHLTYARDEAVRRSSTVSVATLDPAEPTFWERGWTVFVDTNEDGQLDQGEQQLRIVDALNVANFTIRLQGGGTAISFDRLGISQPNRFDLIESTDQDNKITKQISISLTGHISIPTSTPAPSM